MSAETYSGPVVHTDDPADDHLRERTEHAKQVYRGHFLDVRCDTVRMPDGAPATREYIVHPGASMVVALHDDGTLVVERQWRYPVGRVMLEFPAGKRDVGESYGACAMRELAEETGYVATEWARAGILHNAIAYSTEGIEVWFARGLRLGPQRLDHGEFLEVGRATFEEMMAHVLRGEVTDAKTLTGLLWLSNWRSGLWPLVWSAAP